MFTFCICRNAFRNRGNFVVLKLSTWARHELSSISDNCTSHRYGSLRHCDGHIFHFPFGSGTCIGWVGLCISMLIQLFSCPLWPRLICIRWAHLVEKINFPKGATGGSGSSSHIVGCISYVYRNPDKWKMNACVSGCAGVVPCSRTFARLCTDGERLSKVVVLCACKYLFTTNARVTKYFQLKVCLPAFRELWLTRRDSQL